MSNGSSRVTRSVHLLIGRSVVGLSVIISWKLHLNAPIGTLVIIIINIIVFIIIFNFLGYFRGEWSRPVAAAADDVLELWSDLRFPF